MNSDTLCGIINNNNGIVCCSNCEFCTCISRYELYCEIYREYVPEDDAQYCEKYLYRLGD